MEFNVHFSKNKYELTVTGAADPIAMTKMVHCLLIDKMWSSGTSVIDDETKLDAGEISVDGIRDTAEACIDQKDKFEKSRVAIVISRDLEYRMNRMWMAFVDGRWDVDCNVFKTKNEALEWMAS